MLAPFAFFLVLSPQAPAEQATAPAPAAQTAAPQSGPAWKTVLDAGRQALQRRDYTQAGTSFREALAQAEQAGDDAGVLELSRQLAGVARAQGQLAAAEQSLAKALPILAKLYQGDSIETADIVSTIGLLQRGQDHKPDAILSFESAVRIREAHPEGRVEALVKDLTSLAALRVEASETDLAVEKLKRALALCEERLPSDSLQVLPVLDALGGLYRDRALYDDAEPLYLRALALREAAFGPDASELISTLDSLAYVYFGQKRFADAEPTYRRLLAIWVSSAGEDHPMVALTLDKMAEFYAFQNRYADAEPLAERALAIRSATLLVSLNQVGRVRLMQAKLQEAEDLYRRTLRIGDDLKAPDAELDSILRVYASLLRELKRPEEAMPLEQRAKAALIRKADREGRRPSPVKFGAPAPAPVAPAADKPAAK